MEQEHSLLLSVLFSGTSMWLLMKGMMESTVKEKSFFFYLLAMFLSILGLFATAFAPACDLWYVCMGWAVGIFLASVCVSVSFVVCAEESVGALFTGVPCAFLIIFGALGTIPMSILVVLPGILLVIISGSYFLLEKMNPIKP